MPDWLRARARTHASTVALACGRERLTFEDLDHRAAGIARRLAACGVIAGARIALLLRNGVPFVVLTHALARLGAVMVPLNARLEAPELAWQLMDSRASTFVFDDGLADLANAALATAGLGNASPAAAGLGMDGPRLSSMSWDALQHLEEAGAATRDHIDLACPQGIVYTSATSGRPKGVVLSFGNHWWNAIGSMLNLGLNPGDRWLAPLPLYHVGGLAILWRSVVYGITAVVSERFDPASVNREIDEGGVTIVSVVSTMLQRMLDAHGDRSYPPTLRCVLLGGGPAPVALLERCRRLGVPVAPTYGLTEAASQVTTLHPGEFARKRGSVGRPLFPAEVRIDDGEILVRGPSVMLGYADQPEETARVLRDGWLRTGDLGYLDDDGYLYVLDRREDLIISGGENVYPAEVEAILLQHPDVADAAVVGAPDPQWEQAVTAAVQRRPGADPSANELVAHCASRLAGYKVPKRVWFVDRVPRSSEGKVLRRVLRDRAPAAQTKD
jgi:O-succinylbenzoic acid--CoA ligase